MHLATFIHICSTKHISTTHTDLQRCIRKLRFLLFLLANVSQCLVVVCFVLNGSLHTCAHIRYCNSVYLLMWRIMETDCERDRFLGTTLLLVDRSTDYSFRCHLLHYYFLLSTAYSKNFCRIRILFYPPCLSNTSIGCANTRRWDTRHIPSPEFQWWSNCRLQWLHILSSRWNGRCCL